jgi:hypothetical protein
MESLSENLSPNSLSRRKITSPKWKAAIARKGPMQHRQPTGAFARNPRPSRKDGCGNPSLLGNHETRSGMVEVRLSIESMNELEKIHITTREKQPFAYFLREILESYLASHRLAIFTDPRGEYTRAGTKQGGRIFVRKVDYVRGRKPKREMKAYARRS